MLHIHVSITLTFVVTNIMLEGSLGVYIQRQSPCYNRDTIEIYEYILRHLESV